MPNRIIKESIWTSPNLNQVSDLAERHFYRILVLPDDFGCCELTALVVKGRCYPLKPSVTIKQIKAWQWELELANIIRTWDEGGRIYGYFLAFGKHQRIRSLHQRRTPVPPEHILDDTCRQVTEDDRLNPNPNPNPNPIHTHLVKGFNSFWKSYPKKKSKGDAEKAFAKINPNGKLLAAMLAKIEQGKKSEDWQKDSGKYIPHPATWLRAKGWEDEDTESKQPGRDYYPGGIEVVN